MDGSGGALVRFGRRRRRCRSRRRRRRRQPRLLGFAVLLLLLLLLLLNVDGTLQQVVRDGFVDDLILF